MSLNGENSRKFLKEFILLYRNLPCLWHVNNTGYKDRRTRNRAYDALVDKLKEVNVGADRDMVLRKINVLRTTFRREYKKVRASEWNHPRARYKTNLWWYDLMLFVVDQYNSQTRNEINNDNEMKMETTEFEEYHEEIAEQRAPGLTDNMKKTELIVPSEVPFHTVFLETNDMCSREPCAEVIRGQQHYTQNTSASKNMEHTCEIVLRENGSAHNDDFQIFTTYVASKLKRCTARQSMIAEKIIADVLLRANLGTLTENTCLSENSL